MLILTLGAVLVCGQLEDTVEGYGVVRPAKLKKIRAQIDGIVETVLIEEGQEVGVGDTLLVLKSDELKFRAETAKQEFQAAQDDLEDLKREYAVITQSSSYETQVVRENPLVQQKKAENAKENYERAEEMYKRQIISLEQRNNVKLAYEVLLSDYETGKRQLKLMEDRYSKQIQQKENKVCLAREALALAETNLSNSVITAPISGAVLTQEVENLKDTQIQAGQEVLQLGDLSQMSFIADVAEKDVPKVKVSQEARIFLDAFPHQKYKVFKGQVVRISTKPETTPRGLVFATDIRLDEPWVEEGSIRIFLKNGLSGKCEIVIQHNVRLIKKLFEKIFRVAERASTINLCLIDSGDCGCFFGRDG